ncbi:MAG: prepilin-type N-terminal cleavage/methylation domain-containing protein [Acidimicrobiales bacterium]|jgi:prepilin-type N-terminal cleavage/methylation domain-containing protein
MRGNPGVGSHDPEKASEEAGAAVRHASETGLPVSRRGRLGVGGDAGFTLIELLMVLVLLPLVMGGVAEVIITSLQDSTGLTNKVSDSADAEIISTNFVQDVQSAALVTKYVGATMPSPCNTPPASGATFLLGLQWAPTTGTTTTVSYWATPSSTAPTAGLVRQICNASTTHEFLSQDVSSATDLPTATISPPTAQASAQTGWVASAGVSNIVLSSVEPTSGYQFNVLAVPRAWSSGSASGGTP